MILGFGSTETSYENKLEQEIEEHVKFKYAGSGLQYYNSDFQKEIEEWIEELALKSREEAKINDKAEKFPDRYSYFYAHVVSDGAYLCFIISFSHINRRHALSPDGWAMMQTKRTFSIAA